jgi:hypothetical protein
MRCSISKRVVYYWDYPESLKKLISARKIKWSPGHITVFQNENALLFFHNLLWPNDPILDTEIRSIPPNLPPAKDRYLKFQCLADLAQNVEKSRKTTQCSLWINLYMFKYKIFLEITDFRSRFINLRIKYWFNLLLNIKNL